MHKFGLTTTTAGAIIEAALKNCCFSITGLMPFVSNIRPTEHLQGIFTVQINLAPHIKPMKVIY